MIDETKEPTIYTTIVYLLFLIFCAGCIYLFAAAVAAQQDAAPKKPRWEISTEADRNHTTGHGWYMRRAERGK